MLTPTRIEQLFVELSLPEAGRELVRFAREHSPVRQVQSTSNNCVIWQFSRKMGNRHLELESRTVEAVAATHYEDNPACLEYWPQPFTCDMAVVDDEGRVSTRRQHTPDFLLIYEDAIVVHEWRDEARLLRLAAQGDYFRKEENGRWRCPAAEAHFATLGMRYEVHSAKEHPRIYVENVRFLEDYNRPSTPAPSAEVTEKILGLFADNASIPHLALIQDHQISADDLFGALVQRLIYANLQTERLDDSASLVFHRDATVARIYAKLQSEEPPPLPVPGLVHIAAGSRIRFDNKDYCVVLVGGGQALLRDDDGRRLTLPISEVESILDFVEVDSSAAKVPSHRKTLADFSEEQLQAAEQRLADIESGSSDRVTGRTVQRWASKIATLDTRIERIVALVDSQSDKGNRNPRLPEKAEALAADSFKFLNTSECRTYLAAYHKYQDMCEAVGIAPMSYPTYTIRAKQAKSTKKREGKRKEYAEKEIPLFLDYGAPVHGVRPHEVCYVDHTILTLATVAPGGMKLGKPTFTLATDGNTTQSRAFFASYDPPSARVVLMVLRDYVRRHRRLPRILVVDGGREFKSRELRRFCEIFEIDLRHRPAAKPRGGTLVERALGATETELIAALKGNTRIMKNVRMVTKSVNPFDRAEWTLPALHGALDEYLFEIKPTRPHPTLGLSPLDFEKMRLLETGERAHTLVRFDENLMLMTSPHPIRPMHRIDRIRGVWADNQYYWADELRSARKLESVEVRIEPWNANVIYVHFRGRWIPAIARDLRPFAGRTYYEVQLALRAERRAAKVRANGARQSKLSAKKMVGLWEPAKFDPRIAVQQREATYLYERLGMTVAMALPELVRHADQTPVSALDSTEKAPAAVSAQANFCPSIPSLPQGALTDVSARSVPSSTESMTPTANEPAETHEPQADTDAESIWGESNEFV